MTVNIRNFSGMNHCIVDKLWGMGYRTNEDVLAKSTTSEARSRLARDVEADSDLILDLARRADLARIKGIGNLYAELLKQAKVFSIQDLAHQDVEDLYKNVLKLNEELRLTRRLPNIENVKQWVDTARRLEPMVKE